MYFDVSQLPWATQVEDSYPEIRKELEDFLEGGKKLWPYFDKSIVSKQGGWKTIPFGAWGVKFYRNRKAAPRLAQLIDRIPGCVSASFNMLEGDTEILPHYGDTDAIMRCHLGIIVPGELPELGFSVQGEDRSWREGKLLVFTDAHQHRAWNKTEKERYIFLFDVVRPECLHKKRRICSRVLASLFLQSLAQKLPFLRRLPLFVQGGIYWVCIASAWCVVPIRNFFARLFRG